MSNYENLGYRWELRMQTSTVVLVCARRLRRVRRRAVEHLARAASDQCREHCARTVAVNAFTRVRAHVEAVLLVVAVALLAVGGVLFLAGFDAAARGLWAVDTLVGVVPAAWWVIDAARHRRLGVDALAVLALVGTLVIGEYLAGAVITVMLASGRTLEARAAARARRELHALLAPCAACRAPIRRTAS